MPKPDEMYRVIHGDATNPQPLDPNAFIYIPHCCNDIPAWGAGFVLAVTKRFGPEIKNAYMDWPKVSLPSGFGHIISQPIFDLGSTQVVETPDPKIRIANMIGQHNVRGYDKTSRPPIRYGALAKCMFRLKALIQSRKNEFQENNVEIHAPKFGSDLAGGQWEIIEDMIKEIWVDSGIPTTIYEWLPR